MPIGDATCECTIQFTGYQTAISVTLAHTAFVAAIGYRFSLLPLDTVEAATTGEFLLPHTNTPARCSVDVSLQRSGHDLLGQDRLMQQLAMPKISAVPGYDRHFLLFIFYFQHAFRLQHLRYI